jgi:hypothetical protein
MLQTIKTIMYNLVDYLKESKKLQAYLIGIDPNIIIDIYLENFAGKKINIEEKIQMEIIKSSTKPTYKTQKGYKSSKLDSLFNDFFKFLTYPNESVQAFILHEKLNMIQEKYNLEFENPEAEQGSILITVSKLAELFIEAAKKNPHQEFRMSNDQLKTIL